MTSAKKVKRNSRKNRVPKQLLVDYEQKMSLSSAAEYLHQIATKFKQEQQLQLNVNNETFTLAPSDRVELELKLEQRGSKYKFEIELEWDEAKPVKSLSIN